VKRFVLDTGPIVALLRRRDPHHGWAKETLSRITSSAAPPLATCEAVLVEACFLLRSFAGGEDAVLALVDHLVLDFRVASEIAAIRRLMEKYRSVPMSLADACLVRMTENEPDSVVLTLDRDFRVYRRNGRQIVPVLQPP
jgi:predicted nucleic acid-binding protein